MKRTRERKEDLLSWLQHHPDTVEGAPDEMLGVVEAEVLHHARALAWDHAISIVRARANFWRHRSGETHCSEGWAAREFCREFSSGLRLFEPIPQEHGSLEFVGKPRLAVFAPDAQGQLLPWVQSLAEEAEHDAWRDVVHFTRNRVEVWIREGEIVEEKEHEFEHSYAEAAVHACELLEWDYTLQFITDAKAERVPMPPAGFQI